MGAKRLLSRKPPSQMALGSLLSQWDEIRRQGLTPRLYKRTRKGPIRIIFNGDVKKAIKTAIARHGMKNLILSDCLLD